MDISFILKKITKTGTIYKTAAIWQEIEELGEEGFVTFTRKEYASIRAMGLNDDLLREIVVVRKEIGLPERGFSAKEFIAISSDPIKTLELLDNIYAGYVMCNKSAKQS